MYGGGEERWWGREGGDGSSKARMACGGNLAEASTRGRGCGGGWWTRGWWGEVVIEQRESKEREEGKDGHIMVWGDLR